MGYTHKPGTGSLFVNTKPAPAPRMSGSITTPDGQKWDIALWTATDRETGKPRLDVNGKNFFNVKVEAPYVAERAPAATPADEDDIPF